MPFLLGLGLAVLAAVLAWHFILVPAAEHWQLVLLTLGLCALVLGLLLALLAGVTQRMAASRMVIRHWPGGGKPVAVQPLLLTAAIALGSRLRSLGRRKNPPAS